VSAAEYDFVHSRMGAGRVAALASRISADTDHRVLVLEAGRTDYRCGHVIHMPRP